MSNEILNNIFHLGGDYDKDSKKAYPGLALYHEGIDLVAIVSTGQDVWSLKVRGQLVNETWNNIGVNWEPYKNDSTLPFTERGGLEVFYISYTHLQFLPL